MSTISFGERMVVEWRDSPDAQLMHWIVPHDRCGPIGDDAFLTLSYSGDRGFARFCGADMKKSNPLTNYGWLEEIRESRDQAVQRLLDEVATKNLIGHKSGAQIKVRRGLGTFMPDTCTIQVPEVRVGDEVAAACELCVAIDVDPKKALRVKLSVTSLAYVKLAMRASVGADPKRSRPQHAARLSATTGVTGVHKMGRGRDGRSRVGVSFRDDDGKKCFKTANPTDDPADVCKRLQAFGRKGNAAAPQAHADDHADDASNAEEEQDSIEDESQHDAEAPQDNAANEEAGAPIAESAVASPSAGLRPEWGNIFRKS